MNVAGGHEGVNARALCVLERFGSAFNIELGAARECRDLHPGEFFADGLDGFEVALRGDGEAGFEDVDTEVDDLGADAEFFGDGHRTARRLFAITQCGIEDVYALTHGVCLCEWWSDRLVGRL